jgi:hypothetical protein
MSHRGDFSLNQKGRKSLLKDLEGDRRYGKSVPTKGGGRESLRKKEGLWRLTKLYLLTKGDQSER